MDALTNQAVDNNTLPVASITGDDAVTEGTPATFTVTLPSTPAASVTVNLTIGQTGDFVTSANRGAKTVTMGTMVSATHTVATVDDSTGEANGAVTATLDTGTGYTVASVPSNAASVTVNDADDDCYTTDTTVSWATDTLTDLAEDCTALLSLKDTLRGTASLNWSRTVRMDHWDGLTASNNIAGTPQRVKRLWLSSKSLTGTLPPALGRLTSLLHLQLENNQTERGDPDHVRRHDPPPDQLAIPLSPQKYPAELQPAGGVGSAEAAGNPDRVV